MTDCPDNYRQLCELCVPIGYNLTDDQIELLKRKLVGAVIMLLPDSVTNETFKISEQPVARP
jgi:hypothetical protein